ncbi:uncharacterized protein G2W53_044141 [Senna tora]|uniref:Uncharacterized protein n=1 Tax=Senna tora TaxID=362788 RepID=A0A834SIJ4_9FABA|nr:uncharacterized protein G2W53_044141 [Senna tora]
MANLEGTRHKAQNENGNQVVVATS